MSSRLDELRRQRALLQEQIARLDREIAAADDASSSIAFVPAAIIRQAHVPIEPPVESGPSSLPAPEAGTEVDELFNQLRAEEESRAAPPTKTGCWVVFLTILGLGAGIAAGLIYFLYR